MICGITCGVLTGVCWGISGVFSQYLFTNTAMNAGWFVAVRMLIAGMIMMICTCIMKPKEVVNLVKQPRDLSVCALTGIVGTMLFQFCCYGTVQKSNAATAIVLQYLCPVIVMLFVCLKKRKLPSGLELIALNNALLGVFLIATHGKLQELVMTGEALSWGIGCAFFMALATVLPAGLYRNYSPQTITSMTLLSGAVVACAIIRPWNQHIELDIKAFFAFAFTVLFGSFLAYIMYAVSVQLSGSERASLFACAEIPTATVLSVVLLGNTFVWQDIVGFLLIGSTIFISTSKK